MICILTISNPIESNIMYSPELYDSLIKQVERKIVLYQTMLNRIQLLEELHNFGDLGAFENSFVDIFDKENEQSQRWLNGEQTATEYVESRLIRLPFEQAYCYKNPEYQTKSRTELLHIVFGENIEWRNCPTYFGNSQISKEQLVKNFEYMCYYVINTRDELLFDIQSLCNKDTA